MSREPSAAAACRAPSVGSSALTTSDQSGLECVCPEPCRFGAAAVYPQAGCLLGLGSRPSLPPPSGRPGPRPPLVIDLGVNQLFAPSGNEPGKIDQASPPPTVGLTQGLANPSLLPGVDHGIDLPFYPPMGILNLEFDEPFLLFLPLGSTWGVDQSPPPGSIWESTNPSVPTHLPAIDLAIDLLLILGTTWGSTTPFFPHPLGSTPNSFDQSTSPTHLINLHGPSWVVPLRKNIHTQIRTLEKCLTPAMEITASIFVSHHITSG